MFRPSKTDTNRTMLHYRDGVLIPCVGLAKQARDQILNSHYRSQLSKMSSCVQYLVLKLMKRPYSVFKERKEQAYSWQ